MSADTTPTRARRRIASGGWSPARVYLLVAGAYLLIVGAVGFAVDSAFPMSAGEVAATHGHVFGVFETNGWHNLAAVLGGAPALAVALARPSLPFAVSLILGLALTGVFVAFLLWDPATFLIASNAADQAAHLAIGAGGIAAAIATTRRR